jgi:hypothetical protein
LCKKDYIHGYLFKKKERQKNERIKIEEKEGVQYLPISVCPYLEL